MSASIQGVPNWLHVAAALLLTAAAPAAAQTSTAVESRDELGSPVLKPAGLTFTEVGESAGVDHLGFGRGAAMVDLDGDGRLDIIGANAGGPDAFYRQRADHTFENMNAAWGIPESEAESWAVVVADFDNDGDRDVFFGVGGFLGPASNQLLRNDLATTGRFTDVTAAAGDVGISTATFGSTALDFDRDGNLDLFFCDALPLGGTSSTHLLKNLGGLVFQEVTAQAGVAVEGTYRHCSAGDFDNDGWQDLAVAGAGGADYVFHNDGNGTFSEVAAAIGVTPTVGSFGMTFEDFDNDGWMDLFVPRRSSPSGLVSGLFLNDGDGTFTDVSAVSGMSGQLDMGHNTGDLDGDGCPEIFIGTGSMATPAPDVLFAVTPRGPGGLLADDVSLSSGILAGGSTRTHGSALGDYDGDGHVDLYVHTGGPSNVPETAERSLLFRNDGGSGSWVRLELIGVLSNRSAVGARAVARTAKGRRIDRQLTAGKGFGNSDDPVLHFGLKGAKALERIDIRWPSGIQQTLNAPQLFTKHVAVETGLLLAEPPRAGAAATVLVCGAPGQVAEVRASRAHVRVELDARGRAEIPVGVLTRGAPAGSTLQVQAWVHDRSAPFVGTLTGRIELQVDP